MFKLYVKVTDEWFNTNFTKENKFIKFIDVYPKDDFLKSIWYKVLPRCYGRDSNDMIISIYNRYLTTRVPIDNSNSELNSIDSMSLSVKFDGLTEEEFMYLSLKYS